MKQAQGRTHLGRVVAPRPPHRRRTLDAALAPPPSAASLGTRCAPRFDPSTPISLPPSRSSLDCTQCVLPPKRGRRRCRTDSLHESLISYIFDISMRPGLRAGFDRARGGRYACNEHCNCSCKARQACMRRAPPAVRMITHHRINNHRNASVCYVLI